MKSAGLLKPELLGDWLAPYATAGAKMVYDLAVI